jgi:hypothetical protein
MPRLNYNPKDLTNALESKLGITFRDGKERTGWFEVDGKKQIRFTIPHVHRSWGKGTISDIRRASKLTNSQFDDLVRCPLSRSGYQRILRQLLGG